MSALNYITNDDVRMFILDDTVERNDLDMDLSFSDEEVERAMLRAGREYNSITPIGVGSVDPRALPNDTNIFLDATAEQLYLSKLAQLSRNDMDYETGGVSINAERVRIQHFKELIKLHRERWYSRAKEAKMSINIRYAYGRVG